MKWIKDHTGRFPERPHYEMEELDSECERLVATFLEERNGSVRYPISTEDLTVLIEQRAADLDMGADLSDEGDDVEGMTLFRPNRKPDVRIDIRLTEDPRMENRVRTTLTHEMGHIKFHGFLWAAKAQQGAMFESSEGESARCFRATILGADRVDWMEWQAGYASGAMLMPKTAMRKVVAGVVGPSVACFELGSNQAEELLTTVQQAFHVSRDAARVRLSQQGVLTDAPVVRPRF